MVALKFLRYKDHFLRETSVRTSGNFNDEFVINTVRVHDSDADLVFREETISKGLSFFPYCLVMPVGERNLADVMVKEHIAGRDWAEIKVMMTQIACAVGHMHDKGFIHGDLKPLNIMRVAAKMKLIDLDSACECTSGSTFAGLKYSSGFIPPEMVYVGEIVVCVRSESLCKGTDGSNEYDMVDEKDDDEYDLDRDDRGGPRTPRTRRRIRGSTSTRSFRTEAISPKDDGKIPPRLEFDLVPAATPHDLWSLGVVFYQIACNVPLFLCDGEGNIGDDDLRVLADWSDKVKNEKLSRVKNPLARNLLSIMLQKEARKRPPVSVVLKHPFLSFHRSFRENVSAAGEVVSREYDVFISYRVATDLPHVETLHRLLQKAGLKVWWDKTSLEPGEPWDIAAFKGMLKSKIFIPLVSRGALQRIATLDKGAACDNMYLEFVLSLELRERGSLDKIFPLMLGDKDEATGRYSKFTFRGANPCYPTSFPELVVESVDAKVRR